MVKRLLVFTFLCLAAFSIQAQGKTSASPAGTKATANPAINRIDLITVAKEYLGTPYRRGSTNPKKGFDCSGFVYYIYKKFEVILPRSSRDYKSYGKALKPEEFEVGDVIVFYGFKDSKHIGHVGIICEANGMKSKFIHASSGKAHSVIISDLDSDMYHRRFYKCIDVIGKR